MESVFQGIISSFVEVAHKLHFLVMVIAFAVGVTLRALVYYTVRRHEWFSQEFEKRVGRFLQLENDHKSSNASFYMVTKRLLERTFFEVFENREKLKRRKPDAVMLMSDRVFLVKMGCAWMVHDLLKQVRFLRYGDQAPKLLNITKNTFLKNPVFNRIFGVIPIGGTNELLNILPGLFVIGGIFGTFLGVMDGLPKLSGMDLNDPEKTKLVMDEFLINIGLSMGASLTGIFLSVLMTFVNTFLSPDRVFSDLVDRFENSLDLLWNYANSNEVPTGVKQFDENRDPLEALAEASLNQELAKRPYQREMDANPGTVASTSSGKGDNRVA